MKKAIIHISDLHICDYLDIKGRRTKSSEKFRLTTSEDESSMALAYIDVFCNKVREKYNEEFQLCLLITGDITDTSSIDENDKAKELILRTIEKLKISKENVFLLPGDHDVNWELCKDAYKSGKSLNPKKDAFLYSEKYRNFANLYSEITQNQFNPSNSIVTNYFFIDEKLYFLGLNSNYKIDFEGGKGYINYETLVNEFDDLKIPQDASIIVAFHHNIFASYEASLDKSWDIENRKLVLEFLKSKNVKCLFYGNEHTRSGSANGADDLLYTSDVGSFASYEPSPSFKIYEIINDSEGLRLKNNIFEYIDKKNIDSYGKWSLQSSVEIGEPTYFELNIKKDEQLKSSDFLGDGVVEIINTKKQSDHRIKISSSYRDELFKIVKNKNLFHSGHFHWSETSRAHNWIDVTKILNNYNDLGLAKNAIIDLISNNIIGRDLDFDFIIGLGIEGNILSTKTSINWNRPYSFLPYSYRYDDHNKFEQDLCFENNGKYKNILIITDVVNDGRTIRKLIQKREKEFFEKVERIYVVSLFYTGDEIKPNSTILNLSESKIVENKIKGDHPENRIEYFYILNLKVQKCPYGENYRDECIIVKENLGCVYRFYDEEKAKKKKEIEQSTSMEENKK